VGIGLRDGVDAGKLLAQLPLGLLCQESNTVTYL
jgi:hypothetical protein